MEKLTCNPFCILLFLLVPVVFRLVLSAVEYQAQFHANKFRFPFKDTNLNLSNLTVSPQYLRTFKLHSAAFVEDVRFTEHLSLLVVFPFWYDDQTTVNIWNAKYRLPQFVAILTLFVQHYRFRRIKFIIDTNSHETQPKFEALLNSALPSRLQISFSVKNYTNTDPHSLSFEHRIHFKNHVAQFDWLETFNKKI